MASCKPISMQYPRQIKDLEGKLLQRDENNLLRIRAYERILKIEIPSYKPR